jgi:protease-4
MPEDIPTPPPPQPPASATPPVTPPYSYAPPYAQGSPYPAYGQPPRRRHSGWFWVAIIGGSLAGVVILLTLMVWGIVKSVSGDSSATTIDGLGGSRIGVIDIDGTILDADKIDTQIRKFGDDSSV